MTEIRIETTDRQLNFKPGDEIHGQLTWQLAEAPDALELRLFWYTSGKGTADLTVVDTQRYNGPGTQGRREFRFRCPDAPPSFTGKLITLTWGLEAVVDPSGDAELLEIVISPSGEPLDLYAHASASDRFRR